MLNQFIIKEKDSISAARFVDFDEECWLQHQVENWTGKHISRWIEGLGDSMNPFLGIIRDNIKNGKHLNVVDNEMLLEIGISGLGARKMILQAIQLLTYFCYEAPRENLQSLAIKTSLASYAAGRVLMDAQRLRENRDRPVRKAELVNILNSLTSSISNLTEHTKRLIFWLDRSPFDENSHYVALRDQISELIWSIVRSVNVQPRTLFEFAGEIVKKMNDLKDVCDSIIRKNDDPAILYTSNVEYAILRRTSSNNDWGLNVQSSYLGVHVISEIKVDSPADRCGKIDAGDEILHINGKTVIGWDLTRVAQRLGNKNDKELWLVVHKRPRDTVPVLIKNAQKPVSKPLANMAPGSQAGYCAESTRMFVQNDNTAYPLNRRRSSTFIGQIQGAPPTKAEERPRLARRASISCGRERQDVEADRPQHLQWNLAEILSSNFETRVVRRARTMRHQPDGYVRSFIDNKLMHEIEDDVMADQLPYSMKCPTEFATITIIEPSEVALLSLAEAKVSDPEWCAPPNDISLQRYIVPATDLNISTPGVDSPRRMNQSVDELPFGGVLPSPSTSSMNSVSSPAPHKLMSLSAVEWPSSEEVPRTPLTPMTMMSTEKIFEGWARRRKTGTELSEATNKWPKCWMVLRGPYLSTYPNQYSQHPDITINVTKCTVSDIVDIRTSKKFVFRLHRPTIDYYFSCFNVHDQKSWINKVTMAMELYNNPGRVMSKSVSYFKEGDGSDSHGGHYNTLTGLPSLSAHGSPDPVNSPGSNNSLPRHGFLSSLTARASQSAATGQKPKK